MVPAPPQKEQQVRTNSKKLLPVFGLQKTAKHPIIRDDASSKLNRTPDNDHEDVSDISDLKKPRGRNTGGILSSHRPKEKKSNDISFPLKFKLQSSEGNNVIEPSGNVRSVGAKSHDSDDDSSSITESESEEEKVQQALLDQWLEGYWYANVQPSASTMQKDECMQKLINKLLIMGDE